MLFHSLASIGSGVDIEEIICSIHERLDVESFQRAWARVVERHAVLRSKFEWEDISEPRQVVIPDVPFKGECFDWKHLAAHEQEEGIETYIQKDRSQGFHIGQVPLMRLALFELGNDKYKFIWSFHHILLDGRAFPLILEEVFTLYEAFVENRDIDLPLPRPYRDYVLWVRERDLAKDEKFWREKLAGFTSPTSLVVDALLATERSAMERGGAAVEVRIPASLTSVLRRLTSSHDISMNTLIEVPGHCCWSRYNDAEDVVYGTTRSCRRASIEGAESMIGLLINTVPVRVKIRKQMKLIDWLKQLREQHSQMHDYIHAPLYEIQRWSDVTHGTPLFESLVVFENYYLDSYMRAKGGKWVNREFEFRGRTNYPLTLNGYDDDEMILKIKFDEGRFTKDTVERMLGHLQTILQNIPENLDTCVAEIPILTEPERNQLLIKWNAMQTDYPRDKCIHALFEEQAERTPDAIALVFEEQRLAYRELNRRANQIAHYLRKLGVGPEVLVGICAERTLEMIVGLLGILKAGGAYVPMDPDLPAARLAFLAEDSRAPVILTQQNLAAMIPGIKAEVVYLDAPDFQGAVAGMPDTNPEGGATAGNLAYVIYTSGSTGRPKGVAVEHRQLLNYVWGVCERLAFEPGWNFATVSTIAADLGNTVVFPSWFTGGCLHVISRDRSTDPTALADYFERHRIDCLKITPAHLAALLTGPHPHKLIPRSRLILGGEASRCDWVEDLRRVAPGCMIFNHYGPTETTVGVLTYRVDGVPNTSSGTLPLGRPLPNSQVYILDGQKELVPVGVPGELYISGDGVARGYWNQPDLTAERFVAHRFRNEAGARMYRTGDRALHLADGNIEFLGRMDDQVKIRGFRIELGEIESVLKDYEVVREAVVMARDNGSGEKRLVAYIIPEGGQIPSAGALRQHLSRKLPDYMVPTAFVMLEKFTLTPNGKVDRRALPLPEQTRPELEPTYVAPRTPVEKTLAEMWAEVLGVERVGVNDNFFDMGGHSLLAVRLFIRIRKWTGLDLPLATLLRTPTVRALAELLDPGRATTSVSGKSVPGVSTEDQQWRSLVPIQPKGNRPPVFFIHAGGGNVLNYLGLLQYLETDQPVYGLQARGVDGVLPPHSSMYEMASHYIAEIRSVQSSGPYFLGGASFGGTVAFEVAQQLMLEGEKVALLALFDTIGPGSRGYRYWRTLMRVSRTQFDVLAQQNPLPLYILKRIHRYLTNRVGTLRIGFFRLTKRPVPLELREWYLLRGHNKAINSYMPQPYLGHLTLFRGPAGDEWPYNEPELGWKDIARGRLKIIINPASHLDFMDTPELGVQFANELRAAQDKAQRSGLIYNGLLQNEAVGVSKDEKGRMVVSH